MTDQPLPVLVLAVAHGGLTEVAGPRKARLLAFAQELPADFGDAT